MEPVVFTTAIRLRLGMVVREETKDRPLRCGLCHQHDVDPYGHSQLKCMKSGVRTRAHNLLRNALAAICRESLLDPSLEGHAFPAEPRRRADICFFLTNKYNVVDLAITHPFRDERTVALASVVAGGAATLYEEVKQQKYAAIVTKGAHFVPFVMDTYGALSQTAVTTLKAIVPLYAQRLGITRTVASRIILGRLSCCVIRSMAAIAALG